MRINCDIVVPTTLSHVFCFHGVFLR